MNDINHRTARPARRLRGCRRLRSGMVALLLLSALLPLAACRRGGPEGEAVPGAAEEDVAVVGRSDLPARGPGLASLAVFPQIDTPLAVLNTQPPDGAEGTDVDAGDARIVVQFNHPVVPLVAVEAQQGLTVPIRIEPAVQGTGRWLNTSTFSLEPAENLLPSTRYVVTVNEDLRDLLGGSLAEPVAFKFVTASPVVIAILPEDNAVDAGASQPISVTFNQPMERRSAEAAFSLRSDAGAAAPGTFRWDGNEMAFLPDPPLSRETRYTATVGKGARAAAGEAATPTDRWWSFTVAPAPALVSSSPGDGAEGTKDLQDGEMTLSFNTPMNTAAVSVTVQPTITGQSMWWEYDERKAHLSGNWLASTTYTVTVLASSPSRFGDPLAADRAVRFTTAPIQPSLFLRTAGELSVYDGYQPAVVYADAINLSQAELELYRMDRAALLRATVSDSRWSYLSDRYAPSEAALVRRWTIDTSAGLDAARRISTTLSTSPDRRLPPGAYFLRTDQGHRRAFLVNTANLTLKHTDREVLVWATDIHSGQPVAGLPIAVWEDVDAMLTSGRTDADGLLRGSFPPREATWAPLAAIAEQDGQVVAAVSSDWREGIETYAFNIGYDSERRPYYAHLYTDRPIYRAGQTVYFRAILRSDDDAIYRLPEGITVTAVVRDPNWERVTRQELALSPYGTVHGEIALSPSAMLGSYTIDLYATPLGATFDPDDPPASVTSTQFRVSAYRKPEFGVMVQAEQPEYRPGETVRAAVSASYYFGGPVAGGKVHWRLIKDDFFFQAPEIEGYWSFIDYDLWEDRYYDPQSEVVSDGEGELDAEGRLVVELPADVSEDPLSQVFTIDVEVTDINNQVVANRDSTVVHKGAFYIGLAPRDYVRAVGEPVAFDVLAIDPQATPVPGQKIELSFEQRTWYSVKEKLEDGGFYWTSHYTDTVVSRTTVETDADGRASATFTPVEGGVHRLVAEARDGAGNQIQSATYAWVTDRRYVNWRQENNDRIDLVTDKKQYRPGETAEILVPAPFAGARALLTIERGTIREARVLTLAGNSETIRVPIGPDFAPNVYVSVVLVKGVGPDSPAPQLKVGYTNLNVSTAGKELEIAVQTDRADHYGPRDKVRYDLTVTGQDGAPVQAELGLALVDKALLALTEDTRGGILPAFYGQRYLGVSTAAALTESADRLNEELAAEKKGGGGGLTQEGTVRRLFRDTAYWRADVVTDEQGRARVEVDLPDNLTTWELNVQAVTGADTRVGDASHEIVTAKDFLVRPVLPRFVVVGDTAQIEAVLHNDTAKAMAAEATLGLVGLEVAGDAARRIEVPARGKVKVVWQVSVPATGLPASSVPDADGTVTVQVRAAGGGLEDAVEMTLPVYRFNAPEVVATSGQVEERVVVEQIELPKDVDTDRGELIVELNPSLAAAITDSLRWLESFPYDCSEQTTSKFLPNVATYMALQQLGLARVEQQELRQQLESQVAKGIQRLYVLQRDDGGWGWWADDDIDASLTAYALYGLHLADQAGFAVRPDAMARAADSLVNYLNQSPDAMDRWDPNRRAFVIYVLAERGDLSPSRAVTLFDRRDGMQSFAKAFLALALARVEGDQSSRWRALVADLAAASSPSATGTSWAETETDYASMNSDARTTAIALLALGRLDPENAVLPGAVRWLMNERRDGHWATTQETAWTILALVEYMRATRELQADYRFHVELNEAELGKGQVGAANVDQAVTLRAAMDDLLPDRPNALVLRRDGEGRLYYTAQLRAYRPVPDLPPVARGIVIGRQYFKVDPATFQPTGEAIDRATIGDVVQVRLTIVAPTNLHYVVVEDPMPAGCEALDTSLRTTTWAAQGPELTEVHQDDEATPWWWRHWWGYWNETQLLDHKTAMFATWLGEGTYEYTYLIRAGLAGNFNTIPARAELMYSPEVFGRSAGGLFTVEAP